MTHGSMFTESVWSFVLKGGCLIEMLKLSREMYNEQRGNSDGNLDRAKGISAFEMGLPTPSFNTAGGWETNKQGQAAKKKKKMNFDDEAVMKAL